MGKRQVPCFRDEATNSKAKLVGGIGSLPSMCGVVEAGGFMDRAQEIWHDPAAKVVN